MYDFAAVGVIALERKRTADDKTCEGQNSNRWEITLLRFAFRDTVSISVGVGMSELGIPYTIPGMGGCQWWGLSIVRCLLRCELISL